MASSWSHQYLSWSHISLVLHRSSWLQLLAPSMLIYYWDGKIKTSGLHRCSRPATMSAPTFPSMTTHTKVTCICFNLAVKCISWAFWAIFPATLGCCGWNWSCGKKDSSRFCSFTSLGSESEPAGISAPLWAVFGKPDSLRNETSITKARATAMY